MISLFRRWLWRRFLIPLPAIVGWAALVRSIATSDGVYVDHETNAVGAPMQWSLATLDGTRVVFTDAICAWSGAPISGATPLVYKNGPDAPAEHDIDHYGVRCARCGVPIHVRLAGMKSSFDAPSCLPCRPFVRFVSAAARFL